MDNRIEIVKGVHPGKFIERDLKKKHLSQRALAEQTSIAYQTINATIAGRRSLTVEQALKIEIALGYEEGFLAILQTYYEIKEFKERALANQFGHCPHIRKSLFWDADFDRINWAKYKKAVVKRVFERGNQSEMDEIKQFYNLSDDELHQILSVSNN